MKNLEEKNNMKNELIPNNYGFLIMGRYTMDLCENVEEFASALRELPDGAPVTLVKGPSILLKSEMGRQEIIDDIRALPPEDIFGALSADDKVKKHVTRSKAVNHEWISGPGTPVITVSNDDGSESVVMSLVEEKA